MTPEIKAALDAAFYANHPNAAAAGDVPSRLERAKTAAVIAAFLRALPAFDVEHDGRTVRWVPAAAAKLAAAVEAAANDR